MECLFVKHPFVLRASKLSSSELLHEASSFFCVTTFDRDVYRSDLIRPCRFHPSGPLGDTAVLLVRDWHPSCTELKVRPMALPEPATTLPP